MKHEHEEVYKLSDLFALYLLVKNVNEYLLTDLVNSNLREFNFEDAKDLEIIDPSPKTDFSLNLKDKLGNKEGIVDLKAITENGSIVIIKIQTYSTKNFF